MNQLSKIIEEFDKNDCLIKDGIITVGVGNMNDFKTSLLQGFLTEIKEIEKAEFGNDNLGINLKIARLRKVVEGAIDNLKK